MDNIFVNNLFWLVIFASSATLISVRIVRSLAIKYDWIAAPRKDRWHSKPTALYGGVGFFPIIMLGFLYLISEQLTNIDDALYKWKYFKDFRLLCSLFIGSSIMFVFGWLDDIYHYRPATKFIAQLVATSLFIVSGGTFPITNIGLFDIAIAYFWFIGIINAVNMLDNMDGLSSGVVTISAITLVLLSVFGAGITLPFSIPIGLLLASVLFAFLWFNHAPATIFMGDSGSLSIGYIIAALAMPSPLNGYFGFVGQTGHSITSLTALLIPVAVIAVPIFDTTFVSITRKWRGKGAMQGGQDHPSHRLVIAGLSEKNAVWLLYSLSLGGGLIALLMQFYPDVSYAFLIIFVLTLILAGVYLGHVKIIDGDTKQLPQKWAPVVSQLLYKRRAAEVLIDTVLILASYYVAYVIKYDGVISDQTLTAIVQSAPLVISLGLLSFFTFGIYRGQWQLISTYDLSKMFMAVAFLVISSIIAITVIRDVIGVYGEYSTSIFLIFGMILFLMLAGSRSSFKLLDSIFAARQKNQPSQKTKAVLIYGAGKNGKVLHEASVSKNTEWNTTHVIGFIDDDIKKSGRNLYGLPVRSASEWTKNNPHIEELWISSKFISLQSATAFIDSIGRDIQIKRLQFTLVNETENHHSKLSGAKAVKHGTKSSTNN